MKQAIATMTDQPSITLSHMILAYNTHFPRHANELTVEVPDYIWDLWVNIAIANGAAVENEEHVKTLRGLLQINGESDAVDEAIRWALTMIARQNTALHAIKKHPDWSYCQVPPGSPFPDHPEWERCPEAEQPNLHGDLVYRRRRK